MENDFYVTLPSNVRTYGYFPENKVANYKTKLASRVTLPGEWEVGLVEMSYTVSWYNIPEPLELKLLFWEKGLPTSIENNVIFPAGRYDNIDDVLHVMNTKMLDFRDKLIKYSEMPKLSVNSKNRIVKLEHGVKDNKLLYLQLNDSLCRILGFEKDIIQKDYRNAILKYSELESKNPNDFVHKAPTKDERKYKGTRPYDISGGFHSLYVYADIVHPSFVGDSYTQLLRLVQIPTGVKFGEQILITYPNTYYIPILTRDFETIEIDIMTDTGERVPFEFGRSIVVLHFRKINKN